MYPKHAAHRLMPSNRGRGVPGIKARAATAPAAIHTGLGSSRNCLIMSELMLDLSSSDATLVITNPAEIAIIIDEMVAARPSPIDRIVYLRAASGRLRL